jgi:DNA repair protein RadC
MTAENRLSAIQTPRQRLQCFGPDKLTTPELLALVIGTGNSTDRTMELAQRLLTEHGGLIGLARLNLYEMCSEPGIGLAKAAQIEASLELGKRLVLDAIVDRPQINSPGDAAKLLMAEMAALEQEHLRVLPCVSIMGWTPAII